MKKFFLDKKFYEEPDVDVREDFMLWIEKCHCDDGVLQLIVRLQGKTSGKLAFVLEEFLTDSAEFMEFIGTVYPIEYACIVEFDINDLDGFYGTVKLKKNKKHISVIWSSFKPSSTPISAARALYNEIDPEKYYY